MSRTFAEDGLLRFVERAGDVSTFLQVNGEPAQVDSVRLLSWSRALFNPCHDPGTGQFCAIPGGLESQTNTATAAFIDDPGSIDYNRYRDPGTSEGAQVVAGLEKLPNYSGTVFRGGSLSSEELATLKKADSYTMSLTSFASKDKEIASEYLRTAGGRQPVLFEIRAQTGKDVTPFGNQEEAVLLLPGRRYRQPFPPRTFKDATGRPVVKILLQEEG